MADSNSTLAKLLERLNSQGGYTPLTEQEITDQANRRVQSQYDAQRLAAQQQADSTDTALAQQLAGLQETYDRQRKQSAENYQQAISQHDRNLVNKGMQRSSYGAATRANIAIKGNEAQDEIGRNQAAQEGNIGAQRAQNQQQLAQKLAQYDVSQKNDALAYEDQLRDREYGRQQDANNAHNSLALNIAQLQSQQEQRAEQNAQWQKQFDASQEQRAEQNAQWQKQFDASQEQRAEQNAQWQKQFDANQSQWSDQKAQWQQQFAFDQSKWNDQKAQWEKEFNAQYSNNVGGVAPIGGNGGGSSSSSSRSSSGSAANTGNLLSGVLAGVQTGVNNSAYSAWMSSMGSTKKQTQ